MCRVDEALVVLGGPQVVRQGDGPREILREVLVQHVVYETQLSRQQAVISYI